MAIKEKSKSSLSSRKVVTAVNRCVCNVSTQIAPLWIKANRVVDMSACNSIWYSLSQSVFLNGIVFHSLQLLQMTQINHNFLRPLKLSVGTGQTPSL